MSSHRNRVRGGQVLVPDRISHASLPVSGFPDPDRTLAAEAAAVLGMRLESDEGDNLTGEVRP
jgi:hypothetical protein